MRVISALILGLSAGGIMHRVELRVDLYIGTNVDEARLDGSVGNIAFTIHLRESVGNLPGVRPNLRVSGPVLKRAVLQKIGKLTPPQLADGNHTNVGPTHLLGASIGEDTLA